MSNNRFSKSLNVLGFKSIQTMKSLVAVLLLFKTINFSAQASKPERCSSVPCVLSAASLVEKLNPKIDPCADFYEYACGSFAEENHTPDETSSVDTTSLMNDKLAEYLLTLFLEPSNNTEPEIHKIVKDFFSSCMRNGGFCVLIGSRRYF